MTFFRWRLFFFRRPKCVRVAAGIAVFCIFSGAVPAFAQTLGQGVDDSISVWRIVTALILCLVLAVAAAFALKARMGGRLFFFSLDRQRSRRLHLVETLRLGHRADVCIVTCDSRELLIAVSEHGIALLAPLQHPERQGTENADGQG